MRDIKFRAYNPRDKKMHYDITGIEIVNDGSISGIFIDGAFFLIEEVYLMQYTGLKNKNGKEIYEGDIVEWAGIKMEVFWGEDIGIGYGFCWKPCGDNSDYHESMTGFIDEYEVIGNIYENKDLLEKEGKEE